ncbi:MAG: hypothetical protein AAF152_17065 [Cyanobacteria bacterium P01_A01_bin.114]
MNALKLSNLLTAVLVLGWVGGAIACVPSLNEVSSADGTSSEIGQSPMNVLDPDAEPGVEPNIEPNIEPASGANDAIALPPELQIYHSENGDYKLEVSTADGWATSQAEGRLYRLSGGDETLLWQQTLPQAYGPRFVAMGAGGQVLLLDEYINVASPYAVMVIDVSGEVLAQHSFDDVQAVLNVSRAAIVEQAESGWWLSGSPEMSDAAHVSVATSGKTLMIDLNDGQLSL